MTKKFSLISIILVSMALTIFSISACKIEAVDESLIKRPDIDSHNSSFKITVKKISDDTDYINVYRIDKSNTNDVLNIGVIFPKNFDNSNTSYIFEDIYVIRDASYKYMIRYHSKDGTYQSSEWTDYYEASFSTVTDKTNFQFTMIDNEITFTPNNGTLLFPKNPDSENSNVKKPDEITDAEPMMALKTDDGAILFSLGKNQYDSEETTAIDLKTTLPDSYFDKEITVLGLVAQKKDLNSKSKVMRLYWSEPTELKISGGKNNVIKVSKDIGSEDVYDYSNPSES